MTLMKMRQTQFVFKKKTVLKITHIVAGAQTQRRQLSLE